MMFLLTYTLPPDDSETLKCYYAFPIIVRIKKSKSACF